ncbi:MAG: hypothetical protein WC050_03385 [Candidatus Paceibacterota bacterium]
MPTDSITSLIIEYRYWIIVPLAFAEGPIVAFSAGFLSFLGYFNFYVVLGVLLFKDIAVDAVCYAVGHWGNRNNLVKKYSVKIGITADHWDIVDRLWDTHPWKTMFLSKVAYGLSLPFLVSAGITHMSYKKFWFYAIQISLIQYGVLMVLGYYVGNSFGFVKSAISIIQIGVAALTVFIVVYYLFSLYMRKRLIQSEKEV